MDSNSALNTNESPSAGRSKTAFLSLVLGILSLVLGAGVALIGLIIRLLKAMNLLPNEGTIGIGGLLGAAGLIFGLILGLAGIILGFKALRKAKTDGSGKAARARIGVSLNALTLIITPIICLLIMLLSDFLYLYEFSHFLARIGLYSR